MTVGRSNFVEVSKYTQLSVFAVELGLYTGRLFWQKSGNFKNQIFFARVALLKLSSQYVVVGLFLSRINSFELHFNNIYSLCGIFANIFWLV